MSADLPDFPPPGVVKRCLELGFGSGPWTWAELQERWGRANANKFVQDARAKGWLLAPLRATYVVPPARDLMTVCWLREPEREEFLIGRHLMAMGVKWWCLSRWLRKREIETPIPIMATDLRPPPSASAGTDPPGEGTSGEWPFAPQLKKSRSLPFLDHLVIVPELPQNTVRLERASTRVTAGRPARQEIDWLVSTTAGNNTDPLFAVLRLALEGQPEGQRRDPTFIEYEGSPELDDPVWPVGLALALGTPRILERVPQWIQQITKDLQQRARWDRIVSKIPELQTSHRKGKPPKKTGGRRRDEPTLDETKRRAKEAAVSLGRPSPNTDWRSTLEDAQAPYLLVPPVLWEEISYAERSDRSTAI